METKKYIIQKESENIIEEKTWSTIDNNSKIHSFLEVSIKYDDQWKTEISEEWTEELERNERELWELENYYDLSSEVERELVKYLEENGIESDGGEESNWDSTNDSAYGVNYRRFYMNIIYYAELKEHQVEELEEKGFEIENEDY